MHSQSRIRKGNGKFPGRKRILLLVFLALCLGISLGLRAALPYWLLHRINRHAGENGGYGWTVKDVDIRLWRAEYELQGVVLRTKQSPRPVFTAERVTSALRFGRLLYALRVPPQEDVQAFQPMLNIDLDAEPGRSRPMARPDWMRLLQRLTLFRISGLAIHQGVIHFHDALANPPVEISLRAMEIRADHLFRSGGDTAHWAELEAHGLVPGGGRLRFRTRLDPEARTPTFKLDFSLQGIALEGLNSVLRAYAGLDVESGRLDLSAHAAASGGGYKGTIRSALHDFALKEGKPKGLAEAVKEKVVKAVGEILQKKSDRNASEGKAPPETEFSGKFPAAVQDGWSMSEYLLKEAFRKGLRI